MSAEGGSYGRVVAKAQHPTVGRERAARAVLRLGAVAVCRAEADDLGRVASPGDRGGARRAVGADRHGRRRRAVREGGAGRRGAVVSCSRSACCCFRSSRPETRAVRERRPRRAQTGAESAAESATAESCIVPPESTLPPSGPGAAESFPASTVVIVDASSPEVSGPVLLLLLHAAAEREPTSTDAITTKLRMALGSTPQRAPFEGRTVRVSGCKIQPPRPRRVVDARVCRTQFTVVRSRGQPSRSAAARCGTPRHCTRAIVACAMLRETTWERARSPSRCLRVAPCAARSTSDRGGTAHEPPPTQGCTAPTTPSCPTLAPFPRTGAPAAGAEGSSPSCPSYTCRCRWWSCRRRRHERGRRCEQLRHVSQRVRIGDLHGGIVPAGRRARAASRRRAASPSTRPTSTSARSRLA